MPAARHRAHAEYVPDVGAARFGQFLRFSRYYDHFLDGFHYLAHDFTNAGCHLQHFMRVLNILDIDLHN